MIVKEVVPTKTQIRADLVETYIVQEFRLSLMDISSKKQTELALKTCEANLRRGAAPGS